MSYLLKERNTCGKFNNIGCQASFHYLSELDRRDRRLGAETSYINFCALFNVICNCNVLATVRSQALAFTGQPFSGSSGAGQTVARMGTLSVEGLESLLRGQDCIVLFCAGKIMCGCSKQFSSLAALADHVARAHAKLPASPHQHQEEGVQEYFRCVRVA